MNEGARYSIEELAERAGVSRRTVRYYVQRGLLPAPHGLGRGRHYGEEHLASLMQTKMLQEKGLDLQSIRYHLNGDEFEGDPHKCDTKSEKRNQLGETVRVGRAAPFAPGEGWFRQPVLPGYELHAGAGVRPLSAGELAALGAFLRDLIERGDL